MTNDLMPQWALNRLQFWQDALVSATNASDAQKMCECARFVEEYGLLIQQISCDLDHPPDPQP